MSSDTLTPVRIFLALRERLRNPIILESSDRRGAHGALSVLAAHPIAEYSSTGSLGYIASAEDSETLSEKHPIEASAMSLKRFLDSFRFHSMTGVPRGALTGPESPPVNGFFGCMSFEATSYFDTVTFSPVAPSFFPDVLYRLYRFVLCIDHAKQQLTVIRNDLTMPPDSSQRSIESELQELVSCCERSVPHHEPFDTSGEEHTLTSEAAYLEKVAIVQKHIQRGDIFQGVLSRRFTQSFVGDDFSVYRALRMVNPSPYLFYLSYGRFALFGSSPEAQLLVKDNIATVNPIAGTYRRTGDEQIDSLAAQALLADNKEQAEHMMLVDLARNDLNRTCVNVHVTRDRCIETYSHVIHVVSEVSGSLRPATHVVDVLGATLPAGTVSGAPKLKAIEIVTSLEPCRRNFYAGIIGFFGPDNSTTHAITIRSFLSVDNTLHYQAGAGIVADSIPENELREVAHKLGALREAIMLARGHR